MSARVGTFAPETNVLLGHGTALLERHEALDEVRHHAGTFSAPAYEFSRETAANDVFACKVLDICFEGRMRNVLSQGT